MENQRISTPPAPHNAQGVRSKAAAHSPTGAGPAAEDPAAAGSFLSLLGTLGNSAASEDPLSADGGVFLQAGPAPDAAMVVQALPQPDAKLLGQTAWQTDELPLTGQRSNGVATLSLVEVAQQAGWTGTELLGQGGLVAQTARMDASAESPAIAGQGGALAGYQRAFARLQGVLSQGAAQAGTGTFQVPGRSPQLVGKQQGAAVSMAMPAAVGTVSDRLGTAGPIAGVLTEPVPTTLQAQWLATAEAQARPAGPTMSKESGASVPGLEGTSHALPDGPRAEGDSTVFDSAAAGAEEAAAEQAAYWVSENLQNAELTVTHDGMPVEVRVSLSGNEAHVDFGSDESQTRELLDAGQQQLRDLLGQEGLVLSGVSVSGAGARSASGDGSAAPRGRPSGRVAVQAAGEGAPAPASRPAVLTDRAVDVFV